MLVTLVGLAEVVVLVCSNSPVPLTFIDEFIYLCNSLPQQIDLIILIIKRQSTNLALTGYFGCPVTNFVVNGSNVIIVAIISFVW